MTEIDMCLRVLAGAGLGFAIGLEREAMNKPAGLRTHLIVSSAAALLTVTSLLVGEKLQAQGEALRVAAGVVTGIGFIGAGTILQTNRSVTGLTTAATVFMAAAIGIAVGAGFYYLAAVAAGLTIFSTWVLLPIENYFGRNRNQDARAGEPVRRPKADKPAAVRKSHGDES
jgi:putative Mg2+ transporter-C (MgtC) family protein